MRFPLASRPEATGGIDRDALREAAATVAPDADDLDNYAEEMLKKPEQADQFVSQAADRKLMTALKDVVTLDNKEISFEEFSKLEA